LITKIINHETIKIKPTAINNLLLPLNDLKKIMAESNKEKFRFISFTGYKQIRN